MDILGFISEASTYYTKTMDGFAKDAFRKKHIKRRRFYTLLLDYINSPGAESPLNFFDWYIVRLDERMKVAPQWGKAWFGLTKTKNEPGFRSFLLDCSRRAMSEPSFTQVIMPWIPDDEYRIISSSTTADISDTLRIVIQLCDEKEATQRQVKKAIFSNLPTIGMGAFFHWVIYSFIYKSFTTPGFEEYKQWDSMTLVEQNFLTYEWIINNYIAVFAVIIIFTMFIRWSMKNWHKRGVFFREHYVDYLPPYSLAKTNEQYSILMIMSSFMKSGKSFADSLMQVKEGANPYVRHQVDKILDNHTVQAHVAINTFYMGAAGSDVRERANHIALETAISELLPSLRQAKTERFERIVSVTMLLSFKPLIFGSLAFSIVPIFIQIFESIPKL